VPDYKTHLFGGLGAYVILIGALGRLCPSAACGTEWLLFALAGSLFPDVDIKSKSQQLFYLLLLVTALVIYSEKRYDLLPALAVATFLPLLVKHRGLFHRLWFVLLATYAIWRTGSSVRPDLSMSLKYDMLFFAAGAISHLWLDFGWRRMLRIDKPPKR